MGLRDKKAARTKLSILEQTIELIDNGSFRDLLVDDICEKAEISKVTLFKYFPKKEDILVYFMRMWLFKRTVELKQDPKTGLGAIRYLFSVLADECNKYPGLILSLIGYISNLNTPPDPQEIKYEERKILYPDEKNLNEVRILEIDQMFMNHLQEAAALGEIKAENVNSNTIQLLITIFYGSALTAHIAMKEISSIYSANLEFILESLK